MPAIVVRLKNALHGLKHAQRLCHNNINTCLLSLEFRQCLAEPVFDLHSDGILMLLYVDVTATCDGGRVTPILYSLLATRLRSLGIILPIHLVTTTRIHVCNRIPIITIRMPTRQDAGVRALTVLSLFH